MPGSDWIPSYPKPSGGSWPDRVAEVLRRIFFPDVRPALVPVPVRIPEYPRRRY